MAYDKKLHLASGFAIAFVFGIANPWIGLGCGMAAGVAKEIYDYFDYGLFDKLDMYYTWAGAVLGAGLALLLEVLYWRIVCTKEVNTMTFEKKKGGCKGK